MDGLISLVNDNGIAALLIILALVSLADALPKAGESGAPTHWTYVVGRRFLIGFTGQLRSAFGKRNTSSKE